MQLSISRRKTFIAQIDYKELKPFFHFRISSVSNSREGSEARSSYQPPPQEPPITVKKLKTLEGYVGFANLPNQVYR